MVNVYDFLLLISIWVGLKPATDDQDFKKKLFLRLVYQIDRFFALIEDPQTKIPTNDYFGHQRAAKLSNRELKIFQLPYLVHFWLDCFFLLWRSLLGSIIASNLRNLKLVKFCFLDLNLACFEPRGPSWKTFKEKNLWYENIKCLDIIPKNFLFQQPESKMFWWISIKKNSKKMRFCHFRPLDGVEIAQKHRFLTRSVQLPLFKHLTRLSSLSFHIYVRWLG